MRRFHIFQSLVIYILFTTAGCNLATVNVDVVSERTALENQVLGTYNAIDKEMLLSASVRAVDSKGKIKKKPEHSQDYKDTQEAMQIQSFYADDLQSLKRLGWVGENNQGLLHLFEINFESNLPDDLSGFAKRIKKDEVAFIVKEINRSRNIIINSVIFLNENLTKSDLPKVKKIFAKLHAENGQKGDKIQNEKGVWTVKK